MEIADIAKSCMPVPSDAQRRIAFGGGLQHDTVRIYRGDFRGDFRDLVREPFPRWDVLRFRATVRFTQDSEFTRS